MRGGEWNPSQHVGTRLSWEVAMPASWCAGIGLAAIQERDDSCVGVLDESLGLVALELSQWKMPWIHDCSLTGLPKAAMFSFYSIFFCDSVHSSGWCAPIPVINVSVVKVGPLSFAFRKRKEKKKVGTSRSLSFSRQMHWKTFVAITINSLFKNPQLEPKHSRGARMHDSKCDMLSLYRAYRNWYDESFITIVLIKASLLSLNFDTF